MGSGGRSGLVVVAAASGGGGGGGVGAARRGGGGGRRKPQAEAVAAGGVAGAALADDDGDVSDDDAAKHSRSSHGSRGAGLGRAMPVLCIVVGFGILVGRVGCVGSNSIDFAQHVESPIRAWIRGPCRMYAPKLRRLGVAGQARQSTGRLDDCAALGGELKQDATSNLVDRCGPMQ